ncbi:hypothetical protein EJ08DRAFT_661792 [Tothia fuscella]|uniref:Uncharacterized protein n=1 Tax=Tothia fuscella TaxID=1048955 RepID=A0A9P4NPD4_9PEZI|nr:hypothetical protein EJ08DRAFT_661792 [Tothia fuscella]
MPITLRKPKKEQLGLAITLILVLCGLIAHSLIIASCTSQPTKNYYFAQIQDCNNNSTKNGTGSLIQVGYFGLQKEEIDCQPSNGNNSSISTYFSTDSNSTLSTRDWSIKVRGKLIPRWFMAISFAFFAIGSMCTIIERAFRATGDQWKLHRTAKCCLTVSLFLTIVASLIILQLGLTLAVASGILREGVKISMGWMLFAIHAIIAFVNALILCLGTRRSWRELGRRLWRGSEEARDVGMDADMGDGGMLDPAMMNPAMMNPGMGQGG